MAPRVITVTFSQGQWVGNSLIAQQQDMDEIDFGTFIHCGHTCRLCSYGMIYKKTVDNGK